MGTMTLTGGAVLTYTSETWGTAPAAAYSAWCAALGVSDTGTDVAINGDDDAFTFALQSPFFATGPGQVFYSPEAGLGLFLTTPTTTTARLYPNIGLSRFYGTESQPAALITYHPAADLKSYNGKVRKSGSTTLIFAQHSNYDNEAISRYDCAIKITPQSIELIGVTTDVAVDVKLFELTENASPSGTPVQSATLQAQNSAATYRYTITIPSGGGDPQGISSAPSPMGAISAIGIATVLGQAANTSPLGSLSAIGNAFVRINGVASASSPLGAYNGTGLIVAGGKVSVHGPLQNPRLIGWHDFTGQIGDTATRYVMDLITPSGTVRVPISSWQATLRTGASSYVQCVIPAAQQWGVAINAATSFKILRRAVTTSGQVIEYLMAESPADTPQFDRGPTNHTCTLSGYAPWFAEQDVSPGTDRTLTGIRSISSGASYRVRCAVDWLLRPGQRGVVDGVPFVVEWINYYVNTNDAYMEVGT